MALNNSSKGTGKFKIGLQLDVTNLEKLCKKNTSGVSIQRNRHHMVLHPIHLKNFSSSIQEMLNNGIAKYDKTLEGILLGYKNIKLINDNGVIHDDCSGIHIDLESDFFIFKPHIGKEMQGVVNRKGKDFLGVLVYNTFNVSLPKPQSEDKWLGDDVHVGYEVLFEIEDLDTSLHLPYIKGKLLSIVSKPVIADILETIQVKKKKAAKVLFDEAEIANNQVVEVGMNVEEVDLPEGKVKKKKKKDKHKHLPEEQENETASPDNSVKKSKKRRLSENLVTNEGKKRKKSEIVT